MTADVVQTFVVGDNSFDSDIWTQDTQSQLSKLPGNSNLDYNNLGSKATKRDKENNSLQKKEEANISEWIYCNM